MNNLALIMTTLRPSSWESSLWYYNAQNACDKLACVHGMNKDSVYGITAALSPRLRWNVNIQETDKVINGLPSRALGQSIKKARRILSGESPDKVLGGNKVRSFYCNISNPSDSYHVTIDIWAARAWFGNLKWMGNLTDELYNRIAADYRTLAFQYNMTPSALQAVIWEEVRYYSKVKATIGQLPLDF